MDGDDFAHNGIHAFLGRVASGSTSLTLLKLDLSFLFEMAIAEQGHLPSLLSRRGTDSRAQS